MISIEKVLLKRFILIALALVAALTFFHSWWADSLYLKMQKQQLQHEGSALAQHLRHTTPEQRTALTLNLPQHSSHIYVIRSQTSSWSSAPEPVSEYPLDDWFNAPGFHEFQDNNDRSFLILSQTFSNSMQFIVIQETTAALAELDKNHSYMLFAIILALAIVLLLQQKVIRETFSKLDPIKSQIDALQRGEKPTLPNSDISEISPLVSAINQLLGYLHNRNERSKNAVGNISHAMKTPIAVITQIAETKDNGLTPKARELLIEQADQLNLIISSELKRARISGRGHQSENFSIQKAVDNLAATLKLIYPDKPLNFDLNITAQTYFPGEQSDFNELMGNLMDNAAKWCTDTIQLTIEMSAEQLHIRISDNGPGCSQSQIERLTKRGVRLDEHAKGHGLGLNIVQTIVEQYQGEVSFTNTQPTGFAVNISIPLAYQA
ncbi:sensor histidine kinase [Neptuniibacter sp. SY11_33]|uniref:sensor histidine kinase n=1 Tax=Neptuniibacter sp. SY11_33 TaxID=3398215 RepID=UPI0039F49A5A